MVSERETTPPMAVKKGGGGATSWGTSTTAHSVSTSGSVGSPSATATATTPSGDSTFLRLNHLDIHADDAGSQGCKKKKRGQRAVAGDKSGRGLRQFSMKDAMAGTNPPMSYLDHMNLHWQQGLQVRIATAMTTAVTTRHATPIASGLPQSAVTTMAVWASGKDSTTMPAIPIASGLQNKPRRNQ